MRKRIFTKLVILGLVGALAFFGYGALNFDKKVRIFNSRIQVGDSISDIRMLLGRPSIVFFQSPSTNKGVYGQTMGTGWTILWVYRGSLFRNDISLIFDRDTGKLIEKNRITHLIDY